MIIQLKGAEATLYREWCEYFRNTLGKCTAIERTQAFFNARKGLKARG